jgi:hypothetical protein
MAIAEQGDGRARNSGRPHLQSVWMIRTTRRPSKLADHPGLLLRHAPMPASTPSLRSSEHDPGLGQRLRATPLGRDDRLEARREAYATFPLHCHAKV